MMKFQAKLLSGLAAFGIYFAILGLVFYYFGYYHDQKATHFVSKNSHAIAVTLQAPGQQKKTPLKHQRKNQAKSKPKKVHHSKPKPISTPEKNKPRPKPKPKKRIKKPVKKIQAKSLFSHIKSAPSAKKDEQSTSKPEKVRRKPSHKKAKGSSKKNIDALKRQKARDKGIENRYLAGVQDKLYGWPTQSNFAGAKYTIGLTIYPSGKFDYVVLTPSSNAEFNRTIRQYLDQLKGIGFDPTPQGKKYQFKVEIVAK